MSYPRYVQDGVSKWGKEDMDAITDHILAGETVSGYLAYPQDYIIRLVGGKYQAVDSTGNLVYGGTDDTGGASGDSLTAVWQACIDAERTAKHIHLHGDLTLAAPVDMTGCVEMVFTHDGGVLTIQSNETVIIDLTGASFCHFEGFNLSISTAYNPTAIFMLAREDGVSAAGGHSFSHMRITDYAAPDSSGHHTVIYNYGSEVITFYDVKVYIRCTFMVLTSYNLWSLSSEYVTIETGGQSMLQTIFTHGSIQNNNYALEGGLNSKVIMDGGGNHVFAMSFFGTFYSYLFEHDPTNDGLYALYMFGNRLEGKLIKSQASASYRSLKGITIHDNWFAYGDHADANGTYHCDLNYTNIAVSGIALENNQFLTAQTFTHKFNILTDAKIDFTNYGETEPYVIVDGTMYRGQIILHHSAHATIDATSGQTSIVYTEEANTSGVPTELVFCSGEGITFSTINTTYVEFSTVFRTYIDFTTYKFTQARLQLHAQGNEAGSGKGIKVVVGTVTLEHTWDGSSLEHSYGAWTDISGAGLTGDTLFNFYGKGSSASENLTVYRVILQLR